MKQYQTIDEFIADYPKDVQAKLEKIRQTIQKTAPEAKEKISYGIPTFALHGNLIHFSAYEKHIGLYPGSSAIKDFAKDLSGYETSKGTIKLPLDKPLPLALISRIVKFGVKQNLERMK